MATKSAPPAERVFYRTEWIRPDGQRQRYETKSLTSMHESIRSRFEATTYKCTWDFSGPISMEHRTEEIETTGWREASRQARARR